MLPDLGTLVRYGRKVILKKWLPDSCIISAAIALDVLEYFGIQAEPFVCTVEVWNPLCRQLLYELGRFPPPEVLAKWREEGGWSIGIGYGTSEPDKWAGHLVAIVEKNSCSICQSTKQIVLNTKFILIRDFNKFYRGEIAHVVESNACLLIYRKKIENRHLTSPDWTRPSKAQSRSGFYHQRN